MEQETQSNVQLGGADRPAASGQRSDEVHATATDRTGTAEQENLTQLMEESPRLAPFAGWLRWVRRPAISVEYNLKKRHVPDLDQDGGQSKQSGQGNQGGAGKDSQGCVGKNSDVMGVSGSFTIRYFDFALGILGLAIVKCVTKGCRWMGRWME